MQTYEAPIPVCASKADISAFAGQVAAKYNFESGDFIQPLVATLGGRIEYKPGACINGKLPESIVIRSPNDFTIFLPHMTSYHRNKLTTADELAHLFLHYPVVCRKTPNAIMVATRWVDENDADQEQAELEANWFAAAFLMPQEAFTRIFSERGARHAAIMFGVNDRTVNLRARSLGLVPRENLALQA
ncbi:MAG: ImmA/IrrE family metallo-endopeptidase [Alphaproteobacteria bacterium]|nr:ImmA/IrrE family metallo-endopeptidase [Alphaproteobacteria bacterium]